MDVAVIPTNAQADEDTLTASSNIVSFSTKSKSQVAGLLNDAAKNAIDIVVIEGTSSISPLSASSLVADYMTDSTGYLDTVSSADCTYVLANKGYENAVNTFSYGSTTTSTVSVGYSAGGGGVRRVASKIVLNVETKITALTFWADSKTGSPGTSTFRIVTDSANNPTSTLANAAATVDVAEGSITTGAYNTGTFATPVTLAAGTYWAEWRTNASSGENYFAGAYQSGQNTYFRYYNGSSWAGIGAADCRFKYTIGTLTKKTVTITLGDKSGNTVNGLFVKVKGSTNVTTSGITFDYRFNNGTYVTDKAINSYIEVANLAAGSSNNNIILNLPAGTGITAYSVLLFYV